ncbi:hypothetical protein [Pseudarthrobacter sp. MM222]|uniref:hypothetical protein n=1 Tax=Pseudarthrobacter sp. MM222 TaxID=3018929 RepID=UPI00221E85E8|nr:hypothetical protein [Pseudarthrobacter sp. MM222]CAI3793925.1 hypothetical protein NKCBBBOE_00930 [Pseudarthrobacter sp. MM222]
MEIMPLFTSFLSAIQTPLGIAIVATLVVSSFIASFVALRRYVRSIPHRFERWLDRKQGWLL